MTYFYTKCVIIIILNGKLSFGIISHFCSIALSMWKMEALTADANYCLFP